MKLFYDCETTGLLDFKAPLGHSRQPHIVQLAACLTDDDGNAVSTVALIVKPNGFVVPPDMCHGITHAKAEQAGVPVKTALSVFGHLAFVASELIAFNNDYDRAVIVTESLRLGMNTPFDARENFCMMKAMTDICKVPHKNPKAEKYSPFKWPSLTEAYIHCFGRSFDGAHDAMEDVSATIAIWKWLQQNVISKKS